MELYKDVLELYIHIPFCVKKCDYCDFLSGPFDADVRRDYTKALCREIKWWGIRLSDKLIPSIYIGGGTPSWLEANYMAEIMDTVHKYFHVDPRAEVTIECNPGTVSAENFNIYRSVGINRISIGLQSANDDELKLLGRIHTFDRFLHTFEFARVAGFDDISVDIMTGLPGQTPAKLTHTIQQVTRLQPEHISAYALIIEKGTPFYDRYKFDAVKQHAGMETEALPNEDQEYELYKTAQMQLVTHGYEQYEISNYAKKGHVCQHNIGYWKRVPYLGMGIGAASLLNECRFSNERNIHDYIAHTDELVMENFRQESPMREDFQELSRQNAMEEFMFLGLRMNAGVSRSDFRQAFGLEIDGVYGPVIQRLRNEGLLEAAEGRIFLNERGMDLSNYAMAQFLL